MARMTPASALGVGQIERELPNLVREAARRQQESADRPRAANSAHQLQAAFETRTPKANDTQVGGDHYKSKAIQPWDYIVSNNLGFLAGNVVKYVTRFGTKGGVVDLKKAKHYLDKLIEVEEQKT